jgi:hypothetical protein
MAEKTFSSIWYASEQKIKSISKLIVYDEKGQLDIDEKNIVFSGNKSTIKMEIGRITNITLARQSINWIIYLIMNLIFLPFLACSLGIIPAILLLIIVNIPGLMIGWNTRWTLIEYQDEKGNQEKAYFADGSGFGWGGLFGGTGKLYNSLKAIQTN